ncbi:MAG: hypothetical protein IT531_21050 [Burkholderiales bacterium]|nr:hypothetical protein [Burkholderiales bacterium]
MNPPAASRRQALLATLLGLALCIALAVTARAQDMRFAPSDEAASDGAWLNYKNRLLAALEAKNRKALLAAIDPDVDNGPEQKRGIEEFRRRWDFDDDRSPLWDELRKALLLGGAFVKDDKAGRRFCAPYVAAKWPTDFDPFRFGAIVAAEVLVKTEPSSESRTLATLGHELVAVEDWEVADRLAGFPQKWTRIRLRGGTGYVPEEQVRSPIEHMACFSAHNGPWRLVSFTAGYLPE